MGHELEASFELPRASLPLARGASDDYNVVAVWMGECPVGREECPVVASAENT